jgi:hypothetical protein
MELLAHRILRWALDFWKIFAPLHDITQCSNLSFVIFEEIEKER